MIINHRASGRNKNLWFHFGNEVQPGYASGQSLGRRLCLAPCSWTLSLFHKESSCLAPRQMGQKLCGWGPCSPVILASQGVYCAVLKGIKVCPFWIVTEVWFIDFSSFLVFSPSFPSLISPHCVIYTQRTKSLIINGYLEAFFIIKFSVIIVKSPVCLIYYLLYYLLHGLSFCFCNSVFQKPRCNLVSVQ